jgi:hypothetical protein
MNIYINILIITSVIIVSTSSAHAYIDPGTGSIILQAILAAFAATIGYVVYCWQKIKTYFKKIFKSEKK